jgi:hypothetical protein
LGQKRVPESPVGSGEPQKRRGLAGLSAAGASEISVLVLDSQTATVLGNVGKAGRVFPSRLLW